MKVTKDYILKTYDYSKRKAFSTFNKKQYNKSLNYIRITAQIAYNFNWVYNDDDLENLLIDISNNILEPTSHYKSAKDESVVFYDSFSLDNKGLTQQYVRALMNANVKLLYITESSKANKKSKDIFKDLESYNKVEIFEVPQDIERTHQIELIYNKILFFKPGKLFMHLSPGAVSAVTAFYALPKEIIKYQINLTDHAFWLGNKCLDYSLEFRPRGCTLSKEKRGLLEKQLLLQPFYPIISQLVFQGFPKECTDDKIVIFSGGAYYKIFGENGEFFNLVKRILLENQNVIFLFAGGGDRFPLDNFIKTNGFENRFILLGHRSDINEVFKHCDIYMGTYPIGGGLMSQFAAINEKPILNYMTNDGIGSVEEFVCQNKMIRISFTDKEKFFEEAKLLINDVNYRKELGKEIKTCLMTKEQFDKTLLQTIISNVNQKQYQDVKIGYQSIFDQYIEMENSFQNNYKLLIIKNFKIKTLFIFPRIFIWFIQYNFSKRGVEKMQNSIKLRLYSKIKIFKNVSF